MNWKKNPNKYASISLIGNMLLDIKIDAEIKYHIDSLVQDCSISSALAMEILQYCTKPSVLSLSEAPGSKKQKGGFKRVPLWKVN